MQKAEAEEHRLQEPESNGPRLGVAQSPVRCILRSLVQSLFHSLTLDHFVSHDVVQTHAYLIAFSVYEGLGGI